MVPSNLIYSVNSDARKLWICYPYVAHVYLHSLALYLNWCYISLDNTGLGITNYFIKPVAGSMHQAISSLALPQVATQIEVQISTSKIVYMACSQTLKCLRLFTLAIPKDEAKIPSLFPSEYCMVSCCH